MSESDSKTETSSSETESETDNEKNNKAKKNEKKKILKKTKKESSSESESETYSESESEDEKKPKKEKKKISKKESSSESESYSDSESDSEPEKKKKANQKKKKYSSSESESSSGSEKTRSSNSEEEEEEEEEKSKPVVIDLGSGIFKAGYAGEEYPSHCFPNVVGLTRVYGEKESYIRMKQIRRKRIERKKVEEEREDRIKAIKMKEQKKKNKVELFKKKLIEDEKNENEENEKILKEEKEKKLKEEKERQQQEEKKKEEFKKTKELSAFEKKKLFFLQQNTEEKTPVKKNEVKRLGNKLLVSRMAEAWEKKAKGEEKSKIDEIMENTKKEEDFSRIPELDYYIGDEALDRKSEFSIFYPMKNGNVTDWEAMEFVIEDTFFEKMNIEPEETYLLVTENSLSSKKNREYLAELFFEEFGVPGIHFVPQPILCLYGAGRTTGLVVDSGDQVTSTVAVFDGYLIGHTKNSVDMGGRQVTEYLQRLMMRAGYSFSTTAEHHITKEIKEKICFVSEDYETDIEKPPKDFTKTYELPDGQEITLDVERFDAPEILFNPLKSGKECPSVSDQAISTFKKCPIDVKEQMFSNVVLAGGNTLFQGFETRLKKEMDEKVGTYKKFKIFASPARQFLAWTGGSVLSDLSTFEDMVITIDEYETNPWSIHRNQFQ